MPCTHAPVFVIGNPRSGTTLVRLMLDAHPELAVPPEGGFLVALERRFGSFSGDPDQRDAFAAAVLEVPKLEDWGLGLEELREHLSRAEPGSYAELAAEVYRLWAIRQGKPRARLGDKNNFHLRHIATLARLYPCATFLHVVRDGRDVVCSYRDVGDLSGRDAPRLPRGIVAAAQHWRENLVEIRRALAALAPGRSQEIRYEDLVRDPYRSLEEVCFVLGEPFDEAMLEFQARSVRTEPKRFEAWKWRTREPLSTEPVGRFRRDLVAEDLLAFECVAGDMLAAYGYAPATRLGAPLGPLGRSLARTGRVALRAGRTARRRLAAALARVRLAWAGRFGRMPQPHRWVFVVGCYDSGTTLLHDLLAAHPEVGSLPREGQELTSELPRPRDLGLPRLWALAPERFRMDECTGGAERALRVQRQWGAGFDDPRRPVLLIKSPTDAARLRWLDRHFPNACFVAIVRDGYAVAEGIRRRTGHELALAARQWARSNEIMLADLPETARHLLVTYEELAERPQQTLARIHRFLELGFDPPGLLEREWRVHERSSVIRNLNAESRARLSSRERSVVEREAGDLLRRLGYAGAGRAGQASS
jgi:hypothetical protein